MTTLVAVRTALDDSGSEHATFLTSLLDTGRVGPYQSNPSLITKQRFGELENQFPQLGKDISPFDAQLPSIQELQKICLHDLPMTREYFGNRPVYFAPSSTAEDAAQATEDVSLNIINNITNPDTGMEDTGYAVAFQSDTLEDMCIDGFVQPENFLYTSTAMCTILPCNTLLPLQHNNEGTTTATLLSGSVVWAIWPPTDHNLNALQMAYESFSEDFDKAKLDVTHELEGGIIFVQNEGECLCIPPFCPMMSFATKTSVLGTYSTITYDNYISMLRKLPLLKAWFTTELAGERKQSEFNCAMLKALDLMLNGEIDPEAGEFDDTYKLSFTENGLLRTLLCTWDEVKDDVVALIGPMDAKVMKDIWSAFLIESKGRECKICGKTIRNKQKLMRKHFVDNHWPKQKVTERIDSMEVLEGDEGEGHEAPLESVEVMEDILCE